MKFLRGRAVVSNGGPCVLRLRAHGWTGLVWCELRLRLRLHLQAACIGMPHPKWDERPIIIAVRTAGSTVTRDALLQFYEGKVAKWQVPVDVVRGGM